MEEDYDLMVLHTARLVSILMQNALGSSQLFTYWSINRWGSRGVASSSISSWRVDGKFVFQAKRSSVTWNVILCKSCRDISEQPYLGTSG